MKNASVTLFFRNVQDVQRGRCDSAGHSDSLSSNSLNSFSQAKDLLLRLINLSKYVLTVKFIDHYVGNGDCGSKTLVPDVTSCGCNVSLVFGLCSRPFPRSVSSSRSGYLAHCTPNCPD